MLDSIKINKASTLMVAHRGLSGIETENTAAAFVAAGNKSFYGIETDVHKTLDGKFVVFHDDTTGRVCVDDMVVEETTYDCLRSLLLKDMQSGEKSRWDLRIPSLAEYISICRRYGKVAVLELKNAFAEEEIYEIAAIIDGLGYLDSTIFISFCIENLLFLRKKYPTQAAQFLVETFEDGLIDRLKETGLDLDIEYTALDEEKIKALHEAGVKVNCWTCDDPAAAEALASWGIDFISSNILE